jgi:hypothetical protein
MAVRAFTDEPEELLSALKKAIDEGVIETWRIDSDGDLTHTSTQWGGRAWMRPKVLEDRLLFNIVASKKETMTRTLYGIYHGRLIQVLLIHFDSKMKTVSATALGTTGDNI